MTSELGRRGFVIDGLTRTGSTTLANLLSCHPDVKCLIEPFHPRRYDGHFHKMAVAQESVGPALNLIWFRWTGIKHVWESNGWPFSQSPRLNDGVVLGARKVLFLQRRNLLRRSISSSISRQLRFWIGRREEFLSRLEEVQLSDINPDIIADEIKRDQAAVKQRLDLLRNNNVQTMSIFYEDLYTDKVTRRQQLMMINEIFAFLEFRTVTEEQLAFEWAHLLDPDTHRWSSPDVYRRIPRIKEIEDRLGCNATGWLFE